MTEEQLQILDHYKNPRNFGATGFESTHSALLENLSCGDKIETFIKIEDNKINDLRFTGEGCSITIGAMSLISDELIGMALEEVSKLDYENFVKEVIGIDLTPARVKCAVLGLEAVKKAIVN